MNPVQFTPDQPSPDPGKWLDDHGDYLFKYASFRLRDDTAAEDAVQETFLAALKAYERFEGRGSERTWLVGILKHKIIDHFRKASREAPLGEGADDGAAAASASATAASTPPCPPCRNLATARA